MPYYVPLGPRGLLIHFGAVVTGAVGRWLYWRDCQRRSRTRAPLAGASPVAALAIEG